MDHKINKTLMVTLLEKLQKISSLLIYNQKPYVISDDVIINMNVHTYICNCLCSLIPHLPEFSLVLGHNIFKTGMFLKIAFDLVILDLLRSLSARMLACT